MVYVGTASLLRPMINKAREDQNGAMQACTIVGGTILSLGLGNIAANWLNKTIDKITDFWDDVKPKQKEEEKADG